MLHKEKLYLTSQRAERRKEVISIVDVETALLTQDNGIMLAYRAVGKSLSNSIYSKTTKCMTTRVLPFESWVSEEENDIKFDPLRLLLLEILRPKLKHDSDSPVTDEYLFAHLSHEDQTVVLEWVNTLLYIKYTLLKTQNPTVADKVSFWLTSRFTKCIK